MISVCIATYNGCEYIQEQLKSILVQLDEDDEIIISDDCSTDGTVDIIKHLNDVRIKLYINTKNIGYSKNFENALMKASGDIIFISDQDDVWKRDKVEVLRKSLLKADMVISNAEIVDKELGLIHPSHFELYDVKVGFWQNFLKTRYIGACMAFNRKLLERALPFPKNAKLCAYDYWLAILAERYFRISLIETPLILYRRHGKNASGGGLKSKNSFFRKIRIRIYSLYELINR